MIWYYVVFLVAFFPGMLVSRPATVRVVRLVLNASGLVLILLFGLQLGGSDALRGTVVSDLTLAVALALAAALGSVLLVSVWLRLIGFIDGSMEATTEETTTDGPPPALKVLGPLGLFAIGGIIGGFARVAPAPALIQISLFVLIAGVGIQSGADFRRLRKGGRWRPRPAQLLLLAGLPVAVIGGTMLLSLVISLALPLSWKECLICTAPMGWQTLGGPLVQQLQGARLGNLAFSANMFRDVLSLLLIPVVARGRGRCALATAPGGVSSMDVLLPVITASSGRACTIYAMWVGACCAFWAPILIWLISEIAF